ncbi:hypothetical protein C1X89_32890 [Pseudomonas sp. GP01-A8]|nr:hypothetical protein C0058_02045 [Pseudomonas sp. NC02]PMU13362.1 hypothetical protein C1X90_32770 [Pseudomonas sp. GP01-A9]PMU31118.1 hypothetical protein C1X89_32890 [Pseudomonas sp. GP01-A8]PMU32481.1 hypothetical protein C1X88_01175 [Pseudomonas sp. GP01-A13]PMU45717.1 hypothetical protein C1X87_28510 [Pseudomonas sp. GP01-A14]PMU47026.1 hypothetical protein C1X85_33130 [Pseudomonas sp. GP01-A6]PMU58713.1 hypothetical protein C1X86_32420 [Pseudomonas sp. GP01-A3]PMU65697.1 hypothetica
MVLHRAARCRRTRRRRSTCSNTQFQCGSGLARESGVSGSDGPTDTPSSRASPLPQLDHRQARANCQPQKKPRLARAGAFWWCATTA